MAVSSEPLTGALAELVLRFRDQAAAYERDGALVPGGRILERAAADLQTAFHEWWVELLTIAESAEWSGYSEDHLRDLVRKKSIPDLRPRGSRGEIRIRRCDLPRHAALAAQLSEPIQNFADKLVASRR